MLHALILLCGAGHHQGLVSLSVGQEDREAGSAAGFLRDVAGDWAALTGDIQRLTETLSASVQEATQLTLEHTLLYDRAVEALQVRRPSSLLQLRMLLAPCTWRAAVASAHPARPCTTTNSTQHARRHRSQ